MRAFSELEGPSHQVLIRHGDTEGVRILVVEDNAAMSDAVQRGLRAEGFEADVAHDGVEGLWRAREFPYDAVVLDIMLPGLNGYEVCRTLRGEGNTTPILMLTAKDGEYDIAEGLEFGADDYLTKPFSFVVFIARLRALLRRANQRPGDDLAVAGALVINTATHTCLIQGAELALTHREYLLLEALVRRVGEPLTRQELLDRVWGADHEGTSNVVDVYIGYLRRKLADAGATHGVQIETLRNVGYRVVAA